jgi:hypothetical protein
VTVCMAAVDRNLSVVSCRWHSSVSQLCCCWSMAVSFWVASDCVLVCRRENVEDWGSFQPVNKWLCWNNLPIYQILFPKIKEISKGRHFDDTDDIRSNTTATLKAIPQNQFQNCFYGWNRHRCIASQWGVLWRGSQWYTAMWYVALLLQWVR